MVSDEDREDYRANKHKYASIKDYPKSYQCLLVVAQSEEGSWECRVPFEADETRKLPDTLVITKVERNDVHASHHPGHPGHQGWHSGQYPCIKPLRRCKTRSRRTSVRFGEGCPVQDGFSSSSVVSIEFNRRLCGHRA